ncbi:MAG: PrgI family protein [Candidatus Sungbacteria bacterium]|nr:PrgI family protein [Candidatus Sungbacteria bacterium]
MQQFQVPQFITVEDKVIGPFTIKQFLYIAAGALLILGARAFLQPFFFWPLGVLIGASAASLAFLKVNERPFPVILKNAVLYLLRPRLYVWKKESPLKESAKEQAPRKEEALVKKIPTLSESKLSDLAWSLDIKEKVK